MIQSLTIQMFCIIPANPVNGEKQSNRSIVLSVRFMVIKKRAIFYHDKNEILESDKMKNNQKMPIFILSNLCSNTLYI